jgi:SHS family sialic acid transporter-like MFS transporter
MRKNAVATPVAGPNTVSRRGEYMALAAAFLGWMFDGLEQGLFPLCARPALRELLGPSAEADMGTWLSGITAMFLLGAAGGGLLFGWLGDRIGRVRAMVWSVLTYAVFSGLCGFADTPLQLAALRFVASLGMGGEWSLGVALVMEIWPSKSRPMLAGLIGAAANVGFLLIALVGLVMASFIGAAEQALVDIGLSAQSVARLIGADKSGWRLLMFVGATPAVLTFFVRIFVPESERWQHAASQAPPARVREIFSSRLARNTILSTCLGATALLGTWGSIQWVPSWADKISNGAPTARSYTQIASAIGAIIGTMLAAYMAELFSRRKTYFMLCLGSLLVCGILFRLPQISEHLGAPLEFGGTFLTLVGLAGCLTAGFYGWLPLYLPELFPTRIRATAQGFAFNFGRVLAAGGTLASGQLLDRFGEDYARTGAITSLIYVVGMVLIWFCPETKGKPLPE